MGIDLHREIREVTLAMLPGIARELCNHVDASLFKPDCVVYLETAARLPAAECCEYFGVGAVPLTIQRKGKNLKGSLARVLAWFPVGVKDSLRRLEANLLWKPMKGHRTIVSPPVVALAGRRVLVLDDAVDTGTSVSMARDWAVASGAAPASVKIAAITATTRLAEGVVDYRLYREMCRFPWSSDSRELWEYQQVYLRTAVPECQQARAILAGSGAQ